MRVAAVLTRVAPDGSAGGPQTVAVAQARGLAARGHDVELVAGWTGPGAPPAELDGVPLRALPARALVPALTPSSLLAPGLRAWLRGPARRLDAAHVHLARDLVPLQAAAGLRRAGVPYVVQPHGMLAPDDRPLVRAVDALATRRAVHGARAVLALQETEVAQLSALYGRPAALLPNAVDLPAPRPRPERARPQVLLLSRLHARKRPAVLVRAALQLLAEGVDLDLLVVGPDQGERAAVEALAATRPDRVRVSGPVGHAEALRLQAAADVVVLPSRDEPFPVALLEAMAAGTPVVCTSSCGLAPALERAGAAAVVPESGPLEAGLAAALRPLLLDPAARRALGARGRAYVQQHLAPGPVLDRLEALYAGCP